MKRKKSIAVNAFYQIIYQILAIITPLITSPHIARQLGAENLGFFTYSYSVVSYFMLFAMLGIVNHGTRTIAQTGKDRKSLSISFANIYTVQIFTSVIAIIIYILYIMMQEGVEETIALLQGLWLISCLFDINWFYFGIEQFKLTVTRNILIKIATVLAVILGVRKGKSPLLAYTCIMAGGQLLSVLVLFPLLHHYIDFVKPKWKDVKRNIRPALVLFVPLLGASVFHTMDKTMLGKISNYKQLGYYYNADKLVNIPLGIINGLGTVFLPRISALLAENKKNEAMKFLNKSFELNCIFSCIMAFGIAGCAKDFIPIFFGDGYESCIILTYLFVPVLLIKSISIFFRMQYLVPMHLDKLYAIAMFSGAFVNIIVNIILIPRLGAMGAVIGTLIAEFVVMLIQFLQKDGNIPIKKWLNIILLYTLIGICMSLIMMCISKLDNSVYLRICIETVAGGIFFLVSTLIYLYIKSKGNKNIFNIKNKKGEKKHD